MSLSGRFMDKVQAEPNSGCWLWVGAVGLNGYGKILRNRRVVSAHRVSYEMRSGPIGPGLIVCHRCDTKTCVNPDHLFVGTQVDNMRDMHAKGRALPSQKLTGANLLELLEMRKMGCLLDEIAVRFGISRSYACLITTGKQVPRTVS